MEQRRQNVQKRQAGAMSEDFFALAHERVELLEKLQQTIDTLHSQLKTQQQFLEIDDVNGFIESMTENQSRLSEMEELMMSLQSLETKSPSSKSRAMEDGIAISLRHLQEAERRTNALANEKLESYRKNVREIRLVKKGARSYLSPYSSSDGMYFDKKK